MIKSIFMVAEDCYVNSAIQDPEIEMSEDYETVCIHNLGAFLTIEAAQKECNNLNKEHYKNHPDGDEQMDYPYYVKEIEIKE